VRSQILGFGANDGSNSLTYVFEMLLSVFLEMVIHMMKIDIMQCNEENNTELDLDPDFDDFDLNLYYPTIRNKLKAASVLVSIQTIDASEEDNDYLIEVSRDRYARIIIKNNPEDTHHFDNTGNTDNYGFIPSDGYKYKTELRDIYAVWVINKKLYTVRFTKF